MVRKYQQEFKIFRDPGALLMKIILLQSDYEQRNWQLVMPRNQYEYKHEIGWLLVSNSVH